LHAISPFRHSGLAPWAHPGMTTAVVWRNKPAKTPSN
jgi:hypothetical protein